MAALLPMILVVAHLGSPAGLTADQVPHFDIAPTCRGDLGSRGACRRDEQEAQAKLQRQWRQFTAGQRVSCTRLSTLGGDPSYVELLTCLDLARHADALPAADRLQGGATR